MRTEKFNAKLVRLLKTDLRFVDNAGELIPAAVKDCAWHLDAKLLTLLMDDKEIEAQFFDEINGRWVFNYNTFITYLSDKNFLANAYTRFRNKIGLNIDEKFLPERGEVALVWPYKDCVLEGGQTRDQEKRQEIFFSELLAPDEINRLLAPKVLTKWRRHTHAGEQPVTALNRADDGTIRENLLVKGNNLLALHSLKLQFRGKVKCVYIDPPYNTENDSFQYNDSFTHSTWLTFMKNRLEVARELLKPDGFILLQIDNRELAYLKCLCDEVFGRANFRNGIIVKKGQKSLQKQFDSIDKLNAGYDTILFYSRESHIKIPNLFKKLNGNRASSWNNHWRGTDRQTMRFELFGITPKTGQWRWAQQRTNDAVENYRTLIRYLQAQGIAEADITDALIDDYYHQYLRENSILKHADFELVRLSKSGSPEHYIPATDTILLSENWTDISVAGRQSPFAHEKNEEILKRIIEWLTESGDIILDFFAGSGTTAAVAHKMNRQWLLVEQMDYVETVTAARLKAVLAGEQGGISKSVGWQGGGDFISCEAMPYNAAFIARIQTARATAELLHLWREIAETSFLNWYVNPQIPEDAVNDFIAIGDVEQQRQLLAELLDKNQLYVNLSEIEDVDFGVSDADKVLNREFYGEALGEENETV